VLGGGSARDPDWIRGRLAYVDSGGLTPGVLNLGVDRFEVPEALVGALIAVSVSGCLHGGHRVEISQ